MSHVLRIGIADQIAYFRAFNDDGSAKTDFTSTTAGAALSIFRTGLSSISIAALSDKAADNTTHADGAVRRVGGNLYTLDLPDSATASYCPSIGVRGSFTGGVIEPIPHPLVGYDPAQVAVGANTVTPPTVAQFEARSLPAMDYATDVMLSIVYSDARYVRNRTPDLVSGKVPAYIDPLDRTGYSLAADQPVNVTKVGGTAVSGPGDLKADVSGLSTFNAATDAVALKADQGVNVVKVAGATAIATDSTVNFPLAIGTSFLSPFQVNQALADYGAATGAAVTAVDSKVSNVQSRLPSVLVGGKMNAYIAPDERTGYALAPAYQATLVSAIDAALLDSGDATDLIGAIVARIDNTNINEASLVAAIKAALFTTDSIANKLAVDGAGRVVIGTNADKTNYTLASGQSVNVAAIAGAPAYASGSAVNFPLAIGTSNLAAAGITQVLTDYGVATGNAVAAVDGKVADVQTRLPAALVSGKISAHIDTNDRTGYMLDPTYQNTLVAAIDAALLDSGDATDLIGAIVARIDNTNVNEASLVAAIKSALFAPESITSRLVVDASGRVVVGTNADKTNYTLASGQSVNVASIAGVPAYASATAVNFPQAIGTSVLTPAGVSQVLVDYGVATTTAVTTVDTKVGNIQLRLPAALVGGKINAHIDASDRTGYALDPSYQSTLVAAIDAALLDSGDATDLIGAIVARIDSTDINEASLVAAIKAALFTPESIANKLAVDGAGRVVVGANADKTNYTLASGQSVNVVSIAGTSVSGPTDLKADVSQLATTAQLNARTLPATDYATSAAVSAISTELAESAELWETIADEFAITAQTSAKLDSMIVLNDGSYQLSADALLLAPQGVTAAEVWQYSDRTLTSGEINVEIDVEALAEEIAEALTSSGLYRLTIEAVDANLDAVPEVKLQILGVAGTTRTTGSDGKSTIDLDPENYTLRVIPPAGYEPVADRPIEISTSDRTEQIELVALFPSITPQPGSCALTILVADQSGVPLAGVPLSAKLPKGYLVNIDTLNLNTQTYQTTNSQGLATLILIRNQPYDLTAQRPDGGTVTLRIQVPDQDQATFSQVFTL